MPLPDKNEDTDVASSRLRFLSRALQPLALVLTSNKGLKPYSTASFLEGENCALRAFSAFCLSLSMFRCRDIVSEVEYKPSSNGSSAELNPNF